MTSIALPVWMVITMVGAPCICLFGALIRMAKLRRQHKCADSDHPTAPFAMKPMMNSAFQNDLHALQIDAIFNALSALIETERIKLKSLICPALSQVSELPIEHHHNREAGAEHFPTNPAMSISDQIAAKVAAGERAGDIANDLGISRSEVELAISMAGGAEEDRPNRLEAVA